MNAEHPVQNGTGSTWDNITEPAANTISVIVNNETIYLNGKLSYIFVDIFDKIDFNLAESHGRAIVTQINGRDAQFAEEIHTGDKIDIYWKEN